MVGVLEQALLSASIQVLFDRIANRRLLEFFRRKNLDTPLEELKTKLLSVNALLGDADEKQVNDTYVKSWLDKLREAVYDAEDVLDQIATEALKSRVTKYFSKLNPFCDSMKTKLKLIDRRLSLIVKQKYLLGLKEGGDDKTSLSMPTTCLIDHHEIYGRDGDRDSILNKLLSLKGENEKLSVIAIVGMAGMGKTTLSQIVYNHHRVGSHFDVGSWVYISNGSNVFEVTKKIYDSLTGYNSNITDLNTLQMKLTSKLNGRKFLLVLDDYWAETFLDWDLLKRPLESGRHGSAIIVTTRNRSVALTMHAAEIYPLPHLSDEACLQIFVHHAFGTRYPEASPTLKEIGEKIVEKCKGHPLSLKTLGSLLTFKTEVKDWNKILQSKVWDLPAHKSNILPALQLSYRHLPGHLKPCFAHCSLFPKGKKGNKRKLIHLWMAEGLLRPSIKEETMEDVGEEYFHELSSRSFLQPDPNDSSSFTMHDLMIDLAQLIGGEFFHKMEHNDPQQLPEKVRHLSFLVDKFDGVEKFEAIIDHSQLRTFLPFSNSGRSRSFEGNLSLLLSKRRCLRVLSLSNYPITCLPESIDHLEHLRYLNLSHTLLEQLPDSVKNLYNLQTLLLSNCKLLTELPTYLKELTNLLHLDISGTDKLTKMPPEFGELTHLQLLTTFVVSREGSKISELGALLELHGALSIVNLQEVVDPKDASDANLNEKEFLAELELKWADGIHSWQAEANVLCNLQPHTNLKSLKIEHYGGIQFPAWLGDYSFSNMVSVHLVSCETCLQLPALGQLPSLKTLHIENMTNLEVVDAAFFGNPTRPFSSLESLTFKNMSAWEQWQLDAGTEFPSLQVFGIQKCPRLGGSLPRVSFPGDASFNIFGCPLLVPLCQRDTGSYWHLVSRLRRLVIDGETIIPQGNAG